MPTRFQWLSKLFATKLGEKRILNYPDPEEEDIALKDIALYLLNNDIYASLGCKTVIIETVEREFVQHILSFRILKDINYTLERRQ